MRAKDTSAKESATGLVKSFDSACTPQVQAANRDRVMQNIVARADDLFAQSAALCARAAADLKNIRKKEKQRSAMQR